MQSLKPGDSVMGLDNQGLVVDATVKKIELGELSSNWSNIRTTRHETAKGNAYYSLIATSDQHVFRLDGTSISLSEISLADEVQGTTSTLNLDFMQKSILVGILLGDGSIHKGTRATSSWSLRWSHSDKQEEYIRWAVETLGSFAKIGHKEVSGHGSHMLTARTSHHPDIKDLFQGFEKQTGQLPSSVSDWINPISLAFWYMDDGSLSTHSNQQDRISFATYSFSSVSIGHLREGLTKMGIASEVQETPKGPGLRLNYQATRMMCTMIAPLIPPSMQYKLPEYLRGGPGWIPRPEMVPGYRNAALSVLRVGQASSTRRGLMKPISAKGWKLETSTGNAYVNGLLLDAS